MQFWPRRGVKLNKPISKRSMPGRVAWGWREREVVEALN